MTIKYSIGIYCDLVQSFNDANLRSNYVVFHKHILSNKRHVARMGEISNGCNIVFGRNLREERTCELGI